MKTLIDFVKMMVKYGTITPEEGVSYLGKTKVVCTPYFDKSVAIFNLKIQGICCQTTHWFAVQIVAFTALILVMYMCVYCTLFFYVLSIAANETEVLHIHRK